MRRIIPILTVLIIVLAIGASASVGSVRLPIIKLPIGLQQLFKAPENIKEEFTLGNEKVKIVSEESVVTDVVKKTGSSVVTVSISKTQNIRQFDMDPFFDPFGFFGQQEAPSVEQKRIEQDIGSGFILTADGTIVTNKHVVADTEAKYKVITSQDKTYTVDKIYRDPANDLAILKIEASGLKPVELGDSSKLKVGQMAIAIGTALGEFRNTVTTGVVSGLGRGITAGSPFEGSEKLDNVIQTDAAINPGNSGGPLLNSAGQVIGVNVAVSSQGQNIGFALPINIIKESLKNFNETGKFSRPYLGVQYQIITRKLALINEIPEGAYIETVVADSPAEAAGLQEGDIITKIDGKAVRDTEGGLSKIISGKKVGDSMSMDVYREEKTIKITATIGENTGE